MSKFLSRCRESGVWMCRWSSLVNSYGLNGMGEEAIALFRRTPKELINERAVVCVLNACSHAGLVEQGLRIFDGVTNKTDRIFTTMVSGN